MIKHSLKMIFETSDHLIAEEIKYRFSDTGIYFEIKDLHNSAFYRTGLGTVVFYVPERDKSRAEEILTSVLSQTADPDFENTDVGVQENTALPQISRIGTRRILFFIFLLASIIILSKII